MRGRRRPLLRDARHRRGRRDRAGRADPLRMGGRARHPGQFAAEASAGEVAEASGSNPTRTRQAASTDVMGEPTPTADAAAFRVPRATALLNMPEPVAAADADFNRAISRGGIPAGRRRAVRSCSTRSTGPLTLAAARSAPCRAARRSCRSAKHDATGRYAGRRSAAAGPTSAPSSWSRPAGSARSAIFSSSVRMI